MKDDIKDRDFMYRLIIGFVLNIILNILSYFRQLFYDGHQQLAVNLSQAIGVLLQPPPPSDKLFRLVGIAKQFVENPESEEAETKLNVG